MTMAALGEGPPAKGPGEEGGIDWSGDMNWNADIDWVKIYNTMKK